MPDQLPPPQILDGMWRVHTANLLSEILKNNGTQILHIPLNIFSRLLAEVGQRASELNDPKLNALMIRLTIYAQADPESEDYDPDLVARAIAAAKNEG